MAVRQCAAFKPGSMKLSIVIPVYNEQAHLPEVLRRVLRVPLDKEIVLVDDFSKDGSRAILERIRDEGITALVPATDIHGQPDVRVLLQPKNQGKGAALRRGIAEASGDFIAIQDADLEYDPEEFVKLVQPLVENRADVVYGSRYARSETRRVLYFWHTLGNKGLTLVSNLFTDLDLTDMETCYKVFRAEVLKSIPIEENRFGFEPEITAKVAKRQLRVFEIPISYTGRSYAEGKKIGVKDLFRTVYAIAKYNLRRK
jgi:glycosyltransferase involved in cell wall biosynthesis